jgi:hypothetical protein
MNDETMLVKKVYKGQNVGEPYAVEPGQVVELRPGERLVTVRFPLQARRTLAAELSRVLNIAEALPYPLSRRRHAALSFVYCWLRNCMQLDRRSFLDECVQRARREYLAARVRTVLERPPPARRSNTVAVRFTRPERDELDACRIGCQNETRAACIKRLVRAEHSHLQVLRTLMSPDLRP